MILRICVVLPTHNDLRVISEVVKEVLIATPFPVLIVDDGSSSPVENVLYSWEVRQALESGRVKVIRFEKSRGKGAALKFAIHHLIARGFTHMFTMDGDGRHNAGEILKLSEMAKTHPWDLIIGVRQQRPEARPKMDKFGQRLTNFFVQYETGSHLKDSGSGFRLYPLFPLQTMEFLSSHYEFEIEVLIRLLWRGVHVREVDIDVPFPDPAGLVTHYRRYIDDARISLLNILLVTVSLIKTHRKPREMATAMGLGVFVGCTPLFGFHTIIVAILAFLLRLNFIVMWIGSHVSTPILAPLVVMTEIWIGRRWMHIGPEGGAKEDLFQWMGGSLILGIILSAVATVITYAVASKVSHRKHPSSWNEEQSEKLRHGLFGQILKRCQLNHAYWIALVKAPVYYLFALNARRGLSEYWKIIEPDDDWRTRQGRILGHFYRFGTVNVDQAVSGFHSSPIFTANGSVNESIGDAMLLSANMGNCAMALSLAESDAPKNIIRVDNCEKGELEMVPFLGRLAPFDVGPFHRAALNGTPVVFTFGFKGEKDAYDLYARSAKVYKFHADEPREIQCYNWAREFVHDVQMFIERYPDQWFNFYPFWSLLPIHANGAKNIFLEDLKTERPMLDAEP